MSDARGFTLAELLIAIAVATIVAGTAYVLLDAGLAMHDRGTNMSVASVGLARSIAMLRADVARSDGAAYASSDSLVLDLENGHRVEWVARSRADGVDVFRSYDDGSGFTERPKRAVAILVDGESVAAGLDFSTVGSRVRARLTGDDRCLTIDATPWGDS